MKSKILLLLFSLSISVTAMAQQTLIAVGPHSEEEVFLVISKDNGMNWSIKTLAYNNKNFSSQPSISCYGKNKSVGCIYGDTDTLRLSTDELETWLSVKLPEPNIRLNAVSCSGDGLCLVGGRLLEHVDYFLGLSTNGGYSWQFKKSRFYMRKYKNICVGNVADGMCAALVLSEYGSYIAIAEHDKVYDVFDNFGTFFQDMSCNEEGANHICVAVGHYDYPAKPEIAMLNAQKNGMDFKKINNFAGNAELQAVHCADENVCAAVGYTDVNNIRFPFLVTTNDSGNNWSVKPVDHLPPSSEFKNVSCVSGKQNICVAVGVSSINPEEKPIIAVSNNAGNTWQIKKLSDSIVGSLNVVKCVKDGEHVICVAGGYGKDKKEPLLLVSSDAGKNWSVKNIENLPENSGDFTNIINNGPTLGRAI